MIVLFIFSIFFLVQFWEFEPNNLFLLGCPFYLHIVACSSLTWFFYISVVLVVLSFYLFSLFAFSRAAPEAFGGSQARGLIGAVATGLLQSHSNTGSEPHLRPTPQLTATPDP